MSRVLLFVQNGDGRPKSIPTPNEYHAKPERLAKHIEAWRPHLTKFKPRGALSIACNADRWWLVECETAYHGRKVIAAAAINLPTVGRILASGGAAPDKEGTP